MLNVKTMLAFSLLLLAFNSFATLSYYPHSTVEKFQNAELPSEQLKKEIFNLSDKLHIKTPGQPDILADNCPAEVECVGQRTNITYEQARRMMFGELFLEKISATKYAVKDVYCNITVNETEGVGPGRIPNPKFMNCEHTWPQSKFSKDFSAELQKNDLHHLFPVDMRANSTRSNSPFAEVVGKSTHAQCTDSKVGNAIDNPNIRSFEPPTEHKGNVARAIYYFSTRYKMKIDEVQVKYLKIWNEEDPVDEAEVERNDKIMQLQGNRNPFIDYPGLINRL